MLIKTLSLKYICAREFCLINKFFSLTSGAIRQEIGTVVKDWFDFSVTVKGSMESTKYCNIKINYYKYE